MVSLFAPRLVAGAESKGATHLKRQHTVSARTLLPCLQRAPCPLQALLLPVGRLGTRSSSLSCCLPSSAARVVVST